MFFKVVFLLGFFFTFLFAQSKSAVQFYDTTGTAKTGKVGWTGDQANGHMFIFTPQDGEIVKTKTGGVDISGTVSATKFSGDGSLLVNLPSPAAPSVGSVIGLTDSLKVKANSNDVASLQMQMAKTKDSSWVLTKIGAAGGGTITGVTPDSGLAGGGTTGTVKLKVSYGGNGTAVTVARSDHSHAISNVTGLTDTLSTRATKSYVDTKVAAINITIADGSITSAKIADSSITGTDVNRNSNLNVATLTANGKIDVEGATGSNLANFGLSADAGRGIYFSASNSTNPYGMISTNGGLYSLALGINGIEKARISPGGSFGIGTNNPVELLDVNGDVAIGRRLYPRIPDSNLVLCNRGQGSLCFQNTNNQEWARITGNGNVGIGTVTPSSKLSIYGNDGVNTSTFDIYTKQAGAAAYQKIAWLGATGSSENDGFFALYDNDIKRVSICANNNRGGDTYFNGGGNVGIGNNAPGYPLDVTGNIRGTNVAVTSDRRYKTDITPIDSSLAKVSKLQGVYYNWDRKRWPQKNFSDSKQIGLIAQDVEKIVPEVVNTDKEGYKSLSYDKLTAVLIEAMKEQQKQIETQKEMIVSLKKEVEDLKAGIKK